MSHLKSSIELVSKGFGFAWLPQPAIQARITGGELKRLDVPLTLDRTAHYYLNYCDVDSLGPAALCFMGELRLQTMAEESP